MHPLNSNRILKSRQRPQRGSNQNKRYNNARPRKKPAQKGSLESRKQSLAAELAKLNTIAPSPDTNQAQLNTTISRPDQEPANALAAESTEAP